MKYILLPFALIFVFSCSSKKASITEPTNYDLKSFCPEDGICTLTIYPNEKLDILTDETGSIYYKKSTSPHSSVVHFQYNKTVEEGLQDGHYQEEVIFEINHKNLPLNLTDQSLQITKMLFGRHCFCKGQAGYFRVNSGSLKFEHSKKTTSIDLQFKIVEVPQIITQIKRNGK